MLLATVDEALMLQKRCMRNVDPLLRRQLLWTHMGGETDQLRLPVGFAAFDPADPVDWPVGRGGSH